MDDVVCAVIGFIVGFIACLLISTSGTIEGLQETCEKWATCPEGYEITTSGMDCACTLVD
jgi:hypothetical protein